MISAPSTSNAASAALLPVSTLLFLASLLPSGVNGFSPTLSLGYSSSAKQPQLHSSESLSNDVTYESSAKGGSKSKPLPTTTDVVVIGSGLAGLSAAALLAHNDIATAVLESHYTPGGAAHTWSRRGYHFESGPSLYSGFSADASPNPLKNIFQIIEEEPEWITYDRWGTVLPNGKKFAAKIGPEEFGDVLKEHGGAGAEEEFALLMKRMEPLSNAAQALSSMALREDLGVVLTLARYPRELFDTLKQGQALNDPFSLIMDEMNIQNKFVKNWLDMLCFLLQGLPAAGTMNAVMAYMLADWYRPGVTLDFPKGGSGQLVDALVRGVEKNSKSSVHVSTHVEEILVEGGKASGVKLTDGTIVKATKAVISNADPFVTKRLLSKARDAGQTSTELNAYMDKLTNTDSDEGGIPNLKSFIHIHAGIDGRGLPIKARYGRHASLWRRSMSQ